jgi:hypothetical protein
MEFLAGLQVAPTSKARAAIGDKIEAEVTQRG